MVEGQVKPQMKERLNRSPKDPPLTIPTQKVALQVHADDDDK